MELAQRAEELEFSWLWFRDVPLYDPNFGDVRQIYDPWTWDILLDKQKIFH